jgi:hypothetical protein
MPSFEIDSWEFDDNGPVVKVEPIKSYRTSDAILVTERTPDGKERQSIYGWALPDIRQSTPRNPSGAYQVVQDRGEKDWYYGETLVSPNLLRRWTGKVIFQDFEQQAFGIDSPRVLVEVEIRYGERFEDYAKRNLFFSYYDFFDASCAKPLVGQKHYGDDAFLSGAKPLVALTEENFYHYLPTRSVARSDQYGVETVIERLLGETGEELIRLQDAPKLSGYYVDTWRDRAKEWWGPVSDERVARLMNDRIRYTGGWTRIQLSDYIRGNAETLERVFDPELTRCILWKTWNRWRDTVVGKRQSTLDLLVQTCHLIVTLKKNPDIRFDPRLMERLKLHLRKGRTNQCNLGGEVLANFWLDGDFAQHETDFLEEVNLLTLQLPPSTGADRREYLIEQFARARGARLLKLVLGRKQPDPDRVVEVLRESPPWHRVENVLDWTEVEQCQEAGLSPEAFEQLMGDEGDGEDPCQQLVKRVLESPDELNQEGDFECPLCGDPLAEKGRTLGVASCPSRHTFHSDCLLEHYTEQVHSHLFGMECPVCQESLLPREQAGGTGRNYLKLKRGDRVSREPKESLTLIIGALPHERHIVRYIRNHPRQKVVCLNLDERETDEPGHEGQYDADIRSQVATSNDHNLLLVDFNRLDDLTGLLKSVFVPGTVDKIIFDSQTTKSIRDGPTLLGLVKLFHQLLKTGGRLYFECCFTNTSLLESIDDRGLIQRLSADHPALEGPVLARQPIASPYPSVASLTGRRDDYPSNRAIFSARGRTFVDTSGELIRRFASTHPLGGRREQEEVYRQVMEAIGDLGFEVTHVRSGDGHPLEETTDPIVSYFLCVKRESEEVEVTVRSLTGRTASVRVNLRADVRSLKEAIADSSLEVPADHQKLVVEGRQLDDGDILGRIGLRSGSLVHMIIRTSKKE